MTFLINWMNLHTVGLCSPLQELCKGSLIQLQSMKLQGSVLVLTPKNSTASTYYVTHLWIQTSGTKKQIWSNLSRKPTLCAHSCRSKHPSKTCNETSPRMNTNSHFPTSNKGRVGSHNHQQINHYKSS